MPCVSEERKSKRARLEEEEYEPEEEDDIVESGEVAKGMFIMTNVVSWTLQSFWVAQKHGSGSCKSLELCYYC